MGFAAGVDLFQTSNGKMRELQTILLLRWLFTPFWTSVSYLPAVPPDELDGMHIGLAFRNAMRAVASRTASCATRVRFFESSQSLDSHELARLTQQGREVIIF